MKTDPELKKITKGLVGAIASIGDNELMFSFLRDLCTASELEEFALRWEIAQRLYDGESYLSIEKKTGASSTTIARVGKYLKRKGSGYQKILERL